ncbi:MAG TPA: hypothetical protein GXX25_07225 [Desulfotomaculum sp.]|nr:hypothetical protein [Desulfotomaculum sp.]
MKLFKVRTILEAFAEDKVVRLWEICAIKGKRPSPFYYLEDRPLRPGESPAELYADHLDSLRTFRHPHFWAIYYYLGKEPERAGQVQVVIP